MDRCNMNCYCSVQCPWGCTEFVDECGYVPYDKFLFALLSKVRKPKSEMGIHGSYCGRHCERKHLFVGVRPDFLTYRDRFFDKEEWPIQPSIRFLAGKGPYICTCKEHDGGSSLRYIHPPRSAVTGVIPCTVSDQLAHAVVAPQMLKTIKCNKFNDTYQVQRCCAGYAGVDSCDIVETGKFHNANILSELNTALSLYG